MVKKLGLAVLVASALSLTACNGQITNQDIGTIAGGAVGGILGHQIGGGSGQVLATVGGTLLGAFVGNQIGHSVDVTDQMRIQQAMANDQAVSWVNPKTNEQYRVVPGKKLRHHCRSYTIYATMSDGSKQPVQGRACLRNGHWVAVNN